MHHLFDLVASKKCGRNDFQNEELSSKTFILRVLAATALAVALAEAEAAVRFAENSLGADASRLAGGAVGAARRALLAGVAASLRGEAER